MGLLTDFCKERRQLQILVLHRSHRDSERFQFGRSLVLVTSMGILELALRRTARFNRLVPALAFTITITLLLLAMMLVL